MSGSLIARAELTAPWGMGLEQFGAAVFHVILSGSGWLRTEEGRTIRLSAGDVAVGLDRGGACFRSCNVPIQLCSVLRRVCRRIADALPGAMPHPSCRAAVGRGTPVGHRSDAERRLRVGVQLHESIPATPRVHAGGLPRHSAAKSV
jgi:hypothetical protein